ncbi:hypothetical protein CBL_11807 [Carabus blaptoides fortunei]
MVRTGDRMAVRSLAAALIPIPPEVTDGSGPSSPRPNTTSYPIPTGLLASASRRIAAKRSRIYFDTKQNVATFAEGNSCQWYNKRCRDGLIKTTGATCRGAAAPGSDHVLQGKGGHRQWPPVFAARQTGTLASMQAVSPRALG